MMTKGNKFAKGSGCYVCRECGKRTRETGDCESGVDLCLACYNLAGIENSHCDGYHDEVPDMDCPLCKVERVKR